MPVFIFKNLEEINFTVKRNRIEEIAFSFLIKKKIVVSILVFDVGKFSILQNDRFLIIFARLKLRDFDEVSIISFSEPLDNVNITFKLMHQETHISLLFGRIFKCFTDASFQ